MKRRGRQEVERDLLKRVAALGPRDPDRAGEDELLAELVDGTQSLDDADPTTLARVLERDGTEFVAELLSEPPRIEDVGRGGFQLLGGARPEAIAVPAALRMAAAVVGMIGAGLLAFVLSQSSGSGADGWLQPGGLDATGRPFLAAGKLGDPGTSWGAELRGPLDADLAPRLVIIADSSEAPFGCGVQLEDGWIVTASSVVESAVRAASWSGEAPRVEVWITAAGVAPFAESRSATVHRHRPARGLSLLRLDDGGDPSLVPLPLVEPADGTPVLWLVARPSLQAPVSESATWSAVAPDTSALWARQQAGSATLRPLTADFGAGAPGSPVLVDGDAGLALAGILADARGESGRVVGAADLRALLAGADATLAPELRPVDPWSLSPGEAMLPVRAPEGSTDWIGRVDSPIDPRVVVFRAAAEPAPGALPRDGFAPGAAEALPVDLFVLLTDDGRLAVGVCDEAGQVVRVWGGERSETMARWTWSRDADGSWRHETSSRGIPFVNPAWLDREQVRWLEGALGR